MLAAMVAAFGWGCSYPPLKAEATATIVDARTRKPLSEPERAAVVLAVRIAVSGSIPVGRFGLTVRASSGLRDYWKTQTWEERLPVGAEAVVELEIGLEAADETYRDGSAVIESSWFE